MALDTISIKYSSCKILHWWSKLWIRRDNDLNCSGSASTSKQGGSSLHREMTHFNIKITVFQQLDQGSNQSHPCSKKDSATTFKTMQNDFAQPRFLIMQIKYYLNLQITFASFLLGFDLEMPLEATGKSGFQLASELSHPHFKVYSQESFFKL